MFGPQRTRWVAGLAVMGAAIATFATKAGPFSPSTGETDLVLVVLDTVRSSSTSLCGYDRPTTPVLERLRREGWSFTCAAISPGTWTVPSHASFFTGWEVPSFQEGRREPELGETLAGQLSARGYQTVFVSANMVLKKPEWFWRPFERSRIAKNFGELAGDALSDAVGQELAEIDPHRPMFLFVNIADAHAPYPEIPDGVGWVPPQPAVQHRMWSKVPDTPFLRYVTGKMSPNEADRYRSRLRNGYDYGIHEADRSLGRLLDTIEKAGRHNDIRIVITSDHGEFIGEHGLIGHGDTLYEPGVRVPVLLLDTAGDRQPDLMEPFPAQHVYELLLGKPVPENAYPSSVVTRRESARPGYSGVAVWGADAEKLLYRDGVFERYDLSLDPGEDAPTPLGAHPLREKLSSLAEAHRTANAGAGVPSDSETTELLRAAGYVE